MNFNEKLRPAGIGGSGHYLAKDYGVTMDFVPGQLKMKEMLR